MRPSQASAPSLSLLYTSFQPRPEEDTANNNNNHPYSFKDYYCSTTSAPTSPLSSTSTITSSSPTLSSSPTSPSLSPTSLHHIRNPRSISDKLNPSSLSYNHNHGTGMILRRRPSNIDTALRQERSRASLNTIERQGLDLLEPRPVDLDTVGINTQMQVHTSQTRLPVHDCRDHGRLSSGSQEGLDRVRLSQPKFVMGGIFEVMEGSG